MSKVSDIIELFIKELLHQNMNQAVKIQRNELANHFKCAPSQINYVLTTRFSIDKGYIIESQRGGGGCIKIFKMEIDKGMYITELIQEIGYSISNLKALQIIQILLEKKIITKRESEIMASAVSDRSIQSPFNIKNEIRANMMKSMLLVLYKNK